MKPEAIDILLKKYENFAAMKEDDTRIVMKRGETTRGPMIKAALELRGAVAKELSLRLESSEEDPFEYAKKLKFEIELAMWRLANGKTICWASRIIFSSIPDKDGTIETELNQSGSLDVMMTSFQLLMMLSGKKQVVKCEGCGKHFFRSRKDKKTCSSACRQRTCAARRTPEQKEIVKQKRKERYLK